MIKQARSPTAPAESLVTLHLLRFVPLSRFTFVAKNNHRTKKWSSTMRTALGMLVVFLLYCATLFAQEGGNRLNQGQQLQQGKDVARRQPNYPAASSDSVVSDQPNLFVTQYQFVDAKILTSLETKGYIAVFGLVQQADKVSDANKKLDDQISAFLRSIASLGIRPEDTYVDFVTQERV